MITFLTIITLYSIVGWITHYYKYKTLNLFINKPKLWTVLLLSTTVYIVTFYIYLILTYCP